LMNLRRPLPRQGKSVPRGKAGRCKLWALQNGGEEEPEEQREGTKGSGIRVRRGKEGSLIGGSTFLLGKKSLHKGTAGRPNPRSYNRPRERLAKKGKF